MSTQQQQISLADITVLGGIDYLDYQLALVKEEQETTGLTIPAQRANLLEHSRQSTTTTNSSETESTADTSADENSARLESASEKGYVEPEVFEGEGELPNEFFVLLDTAAATKATR